MIESSAALYESSGGTGALSDHLGTAYGYCRFNDELRSRIVFAHHNLVTDGVFCEVNMVICRNVLIYFDRVLQNRVLSLFADALARGGFLCLGNRESLHFAQSADCFRAIDLESRLFKRTEVSR
jgi:chemotaxis protein methyltransferase CheR